MVPALGCCVSGTNAFEHHRIIQEQECIEDPDNQFFTSNLGDLSWEIESKTGTSVEFLESQICQDGGYVHCISTSTKENGDGISTLGSIQYSCSNGYVSPVFGDEDSNGVFECASAGIHGAFADLNLDVVTDGGFEATDSSGNDKILSEWGGDGGGTYTSISCDSGEYMIGLEIMHSFYDGVYNIWGFRMICSNQEVCPQSMVEDDDSWGSSGSSAIVVGILPMFVMLFGLGISEFLRL